MGREHLDILMNRAIDGVATPSEREELARAMLADPTIRAEFDELKAAHSSTLILFERLSLPEEFSSRVMKRVQPDHVPTDADLTAVIDSSDLPRVSEPMPSPARSLRRSQMLWRKRANLATILSSVGAFSAAAALLLAIGMLTGIISSGKNPPASQPNPVAGKPDAPKVNPRPELPAPAPKPAPELPGTRGTPEVVQPAPRREEDEDDRQPAPPSGEDQEVRRSPGKPEGSETPDQVDPPVAPEEPKPNPGSSVESPEEPEKSEAPGATDTGTDEPKNTGPAVQEPPRKPAGGHDGSNAAKPREAQLWGRLVSISSGNLSLIDESGKSVRISDGTELRVGQRVQTNVNGLSVLCLSGGGYFAAGRKTTLLLASSGLILEEGELAVDFEGARGQQVTVSFDAYTLALSRGTLLLEKKTRRKMALTQSAGVGQLRMGDSVLALEGGLELDVEYGKMPGSAKARNVVLPDWCGNARAEISLSRVEKLLSERKFSSSVDRRLRSVIGTLTKLPVSTELLVAFLRRVLEEPSFSVPDMVSMLESLVEALNSMPELSANVALQLGMEAMCECKSLAEWAKRFDIARSNWHKRELKGENKEAARKAEEEKRKAEQRPEHKVEGKGDAGDVKDATPGADEKRGKEQAGSQGK